MQRANFSELGIGDAGACQLAGQRFQRTHNRKDFVDIGFGQHRDARTTIGQQVQQTLAPQNFERFAERRARDAEHIAKPLLRDPLATLQLAGKNHLADTRDQLFVQAGS